MEDNQQLKNMMKGEPSDQISLGDDKRLTAKVIKVDGPDGLAQLLNQLGEAFGGKSVPSGVEILAGIPPALPSDSPEDDQWRHQHAQRMADFQEEVSKLQTTKIDTFVLAYREADTDSFRIGGGHIGTADAINALLMHAQERLAREVRDQDEGYDQAKHDARVAAGEAPCGCGKFHD